MKATPDKHNLQLSYLPVNSFSKHSLLGCFQNMTHLVTDAPKVNLLLAVPSVWTCCHHYFQLCCPACQMSEQQAASQGGSALAYGDTVWVNHYLTHVLKITSCIFRCFVHPGMFLHVPFPGKGKKRRDGWWGDAPNVHPVMLGAWEGSWEQSDPRLWSHYGRMLEKAVKGRNVSHWILKIQLILLQQMLIFFN